MNKIEKLEQNIIDYAQRIKENDLIYSFLCQKILAGEDIEIHKMLKSLIVKDLVKIRDSIKSSMKHADALIFGTEYFLTEEDKVKVDNMFNLINETHLLIRDRS